MTLPKELNQKIVDFLTSIPNIQDRNQQQALIFGASLDIQLRNQIKFPGSPGQFSQLLVEILVNYGELEDGRNALEAILEAAKDYVGRNRRKYCETLIRQFQTHYHPPIGYPLEEPSQPETYEFWQEMIPDPEASLKKADISSTSEEWEEKDWRNLIFNLQHHNCILMLGTDTTMAQMNGVYRPLIEILADELARELIARRPEFQSWNLKSSDFAQIAQHYCIEYGRTDLETQVVAFYEQWQNQSNDLYQELAALPFYLILTSTPDEMFCNTLRNAKKVPDIVSYGLHGKRADIVREPTVETPLVFYLYGTLAEPDSLVLTENDLLDFLVSISANKPSLPKYVLGELRNKNKSLLFLGFGFKHWYKRILLHILEGGQKKERRSFALEQFIHKNLEEFHHTVLFFKTSDYKIHICKQDVCSFARELRERYQKSISSAETGHTSTQRQTGPNVFICHSHEDREIAANLYAQLEEFGFRAWLEQASLQAENTQLDRLTAAIRHEIDYVLVLQSQSLAKRSENDIETLIDVALKRQDTFRQGIRFLIPVTIETSSTLENLDLPPTIDISRDLDELVTTIRRDQQKRLKGR